MTTEKELIKMKEKGALTNEEYLTALAQLYAQERKKERTISPEKMRQYILFSVVLLGVFCILAGLGLIIAANWGAIPALLKVGSSLGLLVLSLSGASYFNNRERKNWAETFLFISFLLIGGNIALIQQIYHFAISMSEGSFLWWALSLPLVFITKSRLIPLCSVGLFGFSIWDYIWKVHYMVWVAWLFLFMLLTHFFTGKVSTFLRHLALVLALFFLYSGDILSHSGEGIIGVITTTAFLIFATNVPRGEIGVIRYYNYLFIFVAWRICLLFWHASYNLAHVGIRLIVFGAILLVGVLLHYRYFDRIQQAIKRLVIHE